MLIARTTSGNRVVLPARLRREYGIKAGTRVQFVERDNEIALLPLTGERTRSLCGMLANATFATREVLRGRVRDRRPATPGGQTPAGS